MITYMAIDPGARRTGLAVGDDETSQAGPAGVIEATEPAVLLQEIARAIADHEPDQLVIGIPYNIDGTLGPPARKAQALAHLLQQHTGLEVHQVDERLTSFEADQKLNRSGFTHGQKKARRDALAATAILQDFLNRDDPNP
ncbi:MAG: Holliday junction resolvase RuvX [Phycisphaerae bacterium]|nr:Holliday junction resolvase RuvX [Phycisphaerae bacterium]